MIAVTIYDKGPNEIMDIVKGLRGQGFVQGVDFDFAYHKPYYDYMNLDDNTPARTVFTFTQDKHATLFSLKYGFK